MHRWIGRLAAIGTLALTLLAGQTPRNTATTGEAEAALAQGLADDLSRRVELAVDPELHDYVNRMAVRLARAARLEFPVSVEIYRDAQPRLIALPRAYLFVSTGLLEAVAGESELAAALAHQIGHLAARHDRIAETPRVFIRGWCARLDEPGGRPARAAGQAPARESQADETALTLLRKTGYDTGGLPGLYSRLPRTQAPADATAAALRQAAAAPPGADELRRVTSSEFAALQARVRSRTPARRPPSLLN